MIKYLKEFLKYKIIKEIIENELSDYNKKILNNEPEKKKVDEHKEESYWGALIDIGLQLYSVEWQRVGNMQQSSSIISAIIIIVYSTIVVLITNNIDGLNKYKEIFYTLIILNTVFLVTSFFYFFKLLKPKNIDGLNTPLNINKEIPTEDKLLDKLMQLNIYLDKSIGNISDFIKTKYHIFIKCFLFSIFTLCLQFCLLAFLFLLKQSIEFNCWIYIIGVAFFIIISLINLVRYYKNFLKEFSITK